MRTQACSVGHCARRLLAGAGTFCIGNDQLNGLGITTPDAGAIQLNPSGADPEAKGNTVASKMLGLYSLTLRGQTRKRRATSAASDAGAIQLNPSGGNPGTKAV